MLSLDYVNLKASGSLRDHEERQRSARHRNVLVLILEYLKENGLLETADSLLREAKSVQQDLSTVRVCDNMDLGSILLEYECGYLARVQKKPKFIRDAVPEEKPRAPLATVRKKTQESPGEKTTGILDARFGKILFSTHFP